MGMVKIVSSQKNTIKQLYLLSNTTFRVYIQKKVATRLYQALE